jgi:uncharacterized protein YkwD
MIRMPASRSSPIAVGRLLACVGLAAAAAGLAGCGWFGDRAPPPPDQPSFYRSMAAPGAVVDADTAVSMISQYRQNNGLAPLTLDPVLMRLAADQAGIMASRDKLDHSAGRSFQDRMKASGYNPKAAAENVSAGYHTLDEAFSGWRDSPPHRANMLLKEATRMGIAAAYSPSSKYKVFWTLILAAPGDNRS